MHNHAPVPVGVFGASGYVGQELLRLLAGHPGASVAFATADTAAGDVVEGQHLVKTGDAPLARAELVFSCLPHGVSGRYVQEVRAAGRHLPEVRATLAREGGFSGDLVFTPHLLPVKRGILETIHVPLTVALYRQAAEDLYEAAYAGEPCVLVTRGRLPSLKDVVYR